MYISLKSVNLNDATYSFLFGENEREKERERFTGEKQQLGDKCVRNCSLDNRSWTDEYSWYIETLKDAIKWIILFLFFHNFTWFLWRDEKTLLFWFTPSSLTSPSFPSFQGEEREKKGFSALFLILPHFYVSYREADWKHSLAFQTMKKGDPQSFIRYEDRQ